MRHPPKSQPDPLSNPEARADARSAPAVRSAAVSFTEESEHTVLDGALMRLLTKLLEAIAKEQEGRRREGKHNLDAAEE
jgi:hypothetical protein